MPSPGLLQGPGAGQNRGPLGNGAGGALGSLLEGEVILDLLWGQVHASPALLPSCPVCTAQPAPGASPGRSMDHVIRGKSPWDPGGGAACSFTLAWKFTASRVPSSSITNECQMRAASLGGAGGSLLPICLPKPPTSLSGILQDTHGLGTPRS